MNRTAIVGGCRTPFVKAGGVFSKYSALDLGLHVMTSLFTKLKLNPDRVDEFIFGSVLLDPRIPNLAREIVVRSDLPKTINAHFVSNNCITGLVAINQIREGIATGRINIGIGGGSESMSKPALSVHPKGEEFFIGLSRARTITQKLSLLSKFNPSFLIPAAPSPKEPSTGLTMGQHMELTAQEMGVSRESQDLVAFNSHKNAAANFSAISSEIAPFNGVDKDNIVRADTTIEKLSKLSPVFDRTGKGTLTAGNSSALTDGASLVCLMSEEAARSENREIIAYVEDVAYAAVSPKDGLLMAPCVALPKLLQRNNLSVSEIDLFEVHEAFGAQVVANRMVWEHGWNKPYPVTPIGAIPDHKINVNGGSIAIGHPFAATGGRLVLNLANTLKAKGLKTGVISVCAAGGMAAAVLIRRE